MSWDLDKNDWKRVAFGDVVRNVNVTVRDIATAGIDRVIAMEHLSPGELKISRWGSPEDGTTFTRRVRPGQTLFGKRRAYQRKVAYAEFNAICSGDILVLEADLAQLVPEFLPFIVQSNGFYDHALGTSAGSLSPRTSWRDLANFEFDLPSLDEQQRIADLLWAIERERVTACDLIAHLEAARALWADTIFRSTGAVERPIGDLVELCQYGLSTRAGDTGAYPMLRMTNLDNGDVTDEEVKYCDLTDAEFAAHRLLGGDILFNRTNSAELVGRSGIFRLNGDYVFASYLVRLRTRADQLLPDYLNEFINSSLGQGRIRVHLSKGVSQANISAAKLKTVKIPLPPLSEQCEAVARLNEFQRHVASVMGRLDSTTALGRQVRRGVFGGDA